MHTKRLLLPYYTLALLGYFHVFQITDAHEVEFEAELIPSEYDSTSRTTRAAQTTRASQTPKPNLSNGPPNNHPVDVIVHEKEFISQRVKVGLDCMKDRTIIRLNFTSPFRGILGAGKLDTTSCKIEGNGTKIYELKVPHSSSDCGTELDHNSGSIFNTLFIRYHSSLELGGDVAKNIMCRMHLGDLVVGRKNIKMPRTRKPNNPLK